MRQQQSTTNLLKYISLYEDMTHYQENEIDSCIHYLRPLFNRIRIIGDGMVTYGDDDYDDYDDYNVSISSSSSSSSSSYKLLPPLNESDHVNDSAPDFVNYSSKTISLKGLCKVLKYLKKLKETKQQQNNTVMPNDYDDLISTDKQFIMTLEQLYTLNSSSSEEDDGLVEELDDNNKYFTFLEIVHCYKTIVNGMMLMELASNDYASGNNNSGHYSQSKGELSCSITDHNSSNDKKKQEVVKQLRYMLRDRTLEMLTVFRDDKALKHKKMMKLDHIKVDDSNKEIKVLSNDSESSNTEVTSSESVVISNDKLNSDAVQLDNSINNAKKGMTTNKKAFISLFIFSSVVLTLFNIYMLYFSKSLKSNTTALFIPQFSPQLYNNELTERLQLADTTTTTTTTTTNNDKLYDDYDIDAASTQNNNTDEILAKDISTIISLHLDTKLNIQYNVLQSIQQILQNKNDNNSNEIYYNTLVKKQSNVITMLLFTMIRQEKQQQEQIALMKNNCQEQLTLTEKYCSIFNNTIIQQQQEQNQEFSATTNIDISNINNDEFQHKSKNDKVKKIDTSFLQKLKFWKPIKKFMVKLHA